MLRRYCFATLVLILASNALYAATSTAVSKARVIHGIFYSETGQKIDFRVTEGRSLTLTNKEKNLSYQLMPEIVGDDRVQFRIVEPDGGKTSLHDVETFDLSLDGKRHTGTLVPFSLGLNGITVENTAPTGKAGQSRVTEKSAAPVGNSCCVTCGGWQVCCTPGSGYCCDISSSCGSSCSACNAQ